MHHIFKNLVLFFFFFFNFCLIISAEREKPKNEIHVCMVKISWTEPPKIPDLAFFLKHDFFFIKFIFLFYFVLDGIEIGSRKMVPTDWVIKKLIRTRLSREF